MAEATINRPHHAADRTSAVMREVLDRGVAGGDWWDRIARAPKGAWAYVEQAARYALASRAAGFLKARISWGRQLLADLGIINIAGYAATTIEGRAAIRGVLKFGWKVLAFPFKVIGKPVGWVLRHTGRPGMWVHNTAIIGFCWTRDHVVNGYNSAEAWLEEHDDNFFVKTVRTIVHWRIVSRLVDRLAPRWMPAWLRFIIKLSIPSLHYRSKRASDGTGSGSVLYAVASTAADGLDRFGDALDTAGDTVVDVAEQVKAAARNADVIDVRTVSLRESATGEPVEAQILDFGDEVFVRVKGTADFVRGTAPNGYEEVTLAETAVDMVAEAPVPEPVDDAPVPASRAAAREAGREAAREARRETRREAARQHGPRPKPGPGPGPKPGPTPSGPPAVA